VLIIGASGAIGLQLVEALIEKYGPGSVVAALHRTPLPPHLASRCICEFGFDICKEETITALLAKYSGQLRAVWNLAAPLSVDTAKNPEKAHDITVGGMKRLLGAMKTYGPRFLLFSDSIGSYGKEAPRKEASVRWLVDNPKQDPGSDYGVQKREIRALMDMYQQHYGFDCRFAIIPGAYNANNIVFLSFS
jgi:nucleoside-diphosphate-sugar epimerase